MEVKTLTREQRYENICKEYPDIEVDDEEDLCIQNATLRIMKHCWYRVDLFKHMEDIAAATGCCQRFIFRFAIDNNFEDRKKLKQKLRNGEPLYVRTTL